MITNSINAYEEAKQVIPGGVDSPVRAFKGVGGTPVFIDRGEGAYLYDIDGNKVNILQLVKLHPEWAANRIQQLEQELSKLRHVPSCSEKGRDE